MYSICDDARSKMEDFSVNLDSFSSPHLWDVCHFDRQRSQTFLRGHFRMTSAKYFGIFGHPPPCQSCPTTQPIRSISAVDYCRGWPTPSPLVRTSYKYCPLILMPLTSWHSKSGSLPNLDGQNDRHGTLFICTLAGLWLIWWIRYVPYLLSAQET